MSHPVAEERPAAHGDALNLVRAAIAEAAEPEAAAQRVVDLLHERFPNYDWVGIYWVDGDDLVLGPWTGPEATDHTRIPIGTGVCGAAAASGRTEIVPDVKADPRYLACFASTRSEIVVPIFEGAEVVGEIDIDGSDLDAFGSTDALFLEEVAAFLAQLRPRA
ncbi:MAG TPA: GAF domain-containing protein [Candidatus Limnocylindrales bacterium]|nr:GAF domain-containing protein [Candidatus Limnocylindrales bacterium]